MNNKIALIASLGLGVVIGSSVTFFQPSNDNESAERKPLYWVAPMDSNYRRDKPGKSPMGMDLIPVYDEGESNNDAGPGTITISSAVVNNLGVVSEPVAVKNLSQDIRTVGFVQYDENQLIHIHPRVEGWIEKLHVKAAGDPVKKGQALYELYSPELVNAQQEYIAELNRGQKGLIEAAKERLRALQISNTFINSLTRNRAIKQTVTFYAPQSGVVDNLNIREGFYVQPGTTMMSIGALNQVWVEAEIFERQAHLVEVGQSVSMTLDFLPSRAWKGKVDYIYPSLDTKTRTLRARLKFDNSDLALKPNMFAQVSIHTQQQRTGLAIPKSALIRTSNQNRVVLDLGNGQFKSVEIKIGSINQNHVEVLKGLSEGEKIVIRAQFLLDSESSKQSDFKRMSHPLELPNATVMGSINTADLNKRILNISRGPIEKWNRGPATMNFQLDRNLDLSKLPKGVFMEGSHIEFTFVIDEGQFIITELRPMNHPSMNHKEDH
jgi:Cu(I)/Ag(I) efflux system membrane fusion protein